SLAQGVPNFDTTAVDSFPAPIKLDGINYAAKAARPGFGRLTLKRVWFENDRSTRGSRSPYDFSYDESSTLANPRYKEHAHDRWGTYRDYGDYCELANYPYVVQHPDSTARVDTAASAW